MFLSAPIALENIPKHLMGLPYMPISWGDFGGQCRHIYLYGIHGVSEIALGPQSFDQLLPPLRHLALLRLYYIYGEKKVTNALGTCRFAECGACGARTGQLVFYRVNG